jgi:hypothetical protein
MQHRTRCAASIGAASLFAVILTTVCAANPLKSASGTPKATTSAIPADMVSFFVGLDQCPSGWEPFVPAQGYMIVGVTNGSDVGISAGSKITSKQPPVHTHAISFKVALSSKSVGAANGGSNATGAKNGTFTGTARTATGNSDLPYYQFLTCELLGSGQ